MLGELINWIKGKLLHLEEYETHGKALPDPVKMPKEKLGFRIFNLKNEEELKPIEESILSKNTVIIVNMKEVERNDASTALRWTHKIKNIAHTVKGNIGKLQEGFLVITPQQVEIYRAQKK